MSGGNNSSDRFTVNKHDAQVCVAEVKVCIAPLTTIDKVRVSLKRTLELTPMCTAQHRAM